MPFLKSLVLMVAMVSSLFVSDVKDRAIGWKLSVELGGLEPEYCSYTIGLLELWVIGSQPESVTTTESSMRMPPSSGRYAPGSTVTT